MVDGDNYDDDDDDDDDDDNEGSGHDNDDDDDDDDDNDGGYGGRDGHHRMRKGRRHDNGTTHNSKIDHR